MIEYNEKYENEFFTASGNVELSDNLQNTLDLIQNSDLSSVPIIAESLSGIQTILPAVSAALPVMGLAMNIFSGGIQSPEEVIQSQISALASQLTSQLNSISSQINEVGNFLNESINQQTETLVNYIDYNNFLDSETAVIATEYYQKVFNHELSETLSDYDTQKAAIERRAISEKERILSEYQSEVEPLQKKYYNLIAEKYKINIENIKGELQQSINYLEELKKVNEEIEILENTKPESIADKIIIFVRGQFL